MPRGDKSEYTDKQKRKAEHIEESYEDRGVPEEGPRPTPGRRSTRSPGAGTSRAAAAACRTPTCRARRAGTRGGAASAARTAAAAVGVGEEGRRDPQAEQAAKAGSK